MAWNPLIKRPDRSVLVHCRAGCFRMDFVRKGNAFEVRRLHSPEVPADDREDWIPSLLKSGPPAAREVIVLSDTVRLLLSELPEAPSSVQLPEILALEAEQVSGLSAADTTIAHTILPSVDGMPRYLLCQLPWETLLAWRNKVRAAGARLLQVGHPGGFAVDENAAQVEHWQDLQLRIQTTDAGKDITVWNTPETDVEGLPAETDDAPIILYGDLSGGGAENAGAGGDTAPARIDLAGGAGREPWAKGLARSLRTLDGLLSGVPLIAVPLPPVGRSQQIKIGVFATILAGIFAFGHSQLIQHQEEQLEAELADLREPRQELSALERERGNLRREIRNMRGEGKGGDDQHLFTRAPSLNQLFAGLATHDDPEAALLKMEGHRGEIHLRGLALRPEAPQHFVQAINETAEPPWRAQLMQRRATFRQDNGGPWEFLIVYSAESNRAQQP